MSAEGRDTSLLDEKDPTGVAQAVELHLGEREPDWDAIEDAGLYLVALARRHGSTDPDR
jgi:hypothetical protein